MLRFRIFLSAQLFLCLEATELKYVDGGNYSYYFFNHPGEINVTLVTFEGDADLYISAQHRNPSYDLDKHDYQSTTCGKDMVVVESDQKRPIYIAVYGHPRFQTSSYILNIDVFEEPRRPEVKEHEESEKNRFSLPHEDKYYSEWAGHNTQNSHLAENERLSAELLLEETRALINETKATQKRDEKELTSRFQKRVDDIKFWRSELDSKLAQLKDELESLDCQMIRIHQARENIIEPISVVEQCIAHRSHRQGADLVEDNVQKHLQSELETFKNTQTLFKQTEMRMAEEIRQVRKRKFDIIKELEDKDTALEIDQKTSNLKLLKPLKPSKTSRPPMTSGTGVKSSPTVSPAFWKEFSEKNLSIASQQIKKVLDMKSEVDGLLATCASRLKSQNKLCDNAFSRRIDEVKDAKILLEKQLSETITKIGEIEENMTSLEREIQSKQGPLATVQQKIQQRKSRPNVEHVLDDVEMMLHREAQNLVENIKKLEYYLLKSKNCHVALQKTRLELETEINIKSNSIYIDEVKCMSLRRAIKIQAY